jgi:glycosyltransferase involved in cell wall biosynthesis
VLGLTPFLPQQVFWLGDGLYRVWVRLVWPRAFVRRVMCLKRAVMVVNLSLEKKILTSPTVRFIANSKLVARQARRVYGVPGGRITVVYPWIDRLRFNAQTRGRWRSIMRRELGIGEHEVALLFAANNFQRKGLALLLAGLAKSHQTEARLRLIVVGGGAIAKFRRRAKKLGIAEAVVFTGAVAEIERYFAAADVFALPTRYDPCATVCLEAMACGLPVLTTALNGAAEFIDEGENGFVLAADAGIDEWMSRIQAIASREHRAIAAAYERVSQLSTADHLSQVVAVLEAAAVEPSGTAPVRVEPSLWVNEEFLPLLEHHGLASFAALLQTPKRSEIEYNRNKRISLLTLATDGREQICFLKFHLRQRLWGGRLLAAAGLQAKSPGMQEWRNILEFQSAGLPTATPVAAGERYLANGDSESFLMTLRLDGYLPLDQYIAQRFARPLSKNALHDKRSLIRAVAELASKMHGAKFHHRDFYLCHIFARLDAETGPDLKIIDLQRVGHARFLARRWVVKDLAQLHYSSSALPLSRFDRLRFLLYYVNNRPRSGLRRKLLSPMLRKARAIEKHDAKFRLREPQHELSDPFDVSLRMHRPASPHELDTRK